MKKFRSTFAAALLLAALAFSLVLSPTPSTALAGGKDCYSGGCAKRYQQCLDYFAQNNTTSSNLCEMEYEECVMSCLREKKGRP